MLTGIIISVCITKIAAKNENRIQVLQLFRFIQKLTFVKACLLLFVTGYVISSCRLENLTGIFTGIVRLTRLLLPTCFNKCCTAL